MNLKSKLALILPSIFSTLSLFASKAYATQVFTQTDLTSSWTITSLGGFITAVIQVVFALSAFLVFIFLIWGGIQWLTSGGDSAATQKARDRITAALVGLAIVALAWAILFMVAPWLGWNNPLDLTLPTLS